MMSPRLESEELAVQHMRDRGKWVPVGRVNMGKGPLNIAWSETVDYSWIGVNVRTIVVVHELVVQRLAEYDADNAGEQNTDDAGD
jgi:hypothetical protein